MMQTVLLTPVRQFLPVRTFLNCRPEQMLSSGWQHERIEASFCQWCSQNKVEKPPRKLGLMEIKHYRHPELEKTQPTEQPTLKDLVRCLLCHANVPCQSTRPIVVAARQVQTAVLRLRLTSARLRDLWSHPHHTPRQVRCEGRHYHGILLRHSIEARHPDPCISSLGGYVRSITYGRNHAPLMENDNARRGIPLIASVIWDLVCSRNVSGPRRAVHRDRHSVV
ncbi:hypothetical protein LY78DRAFT_254307 [Colletotrichum sublineola]|nr:hypothetical protein LY78DRAFT_254307 [Colletotrichum sublineola]